jgi:hypothetical protein
MYSNEFDNYPDGLTEQYINTLIAEAYESAEQAAEPTSALVDGTAAWRRARRIERRTVGAVVRTLPLRLVEPGPNGQEAA